ncbi:hypothetical protein DSECCO2_83070 [anaerobic digester metagenome]
MFFGINPIYIIGFIVFLLLILMLPSFLRMRAMSRISNFTVEVEGMVEESKKVLIKLCNEKGNPEEDPEAALDNFLEFFVITPVELDPNGIVRKFEKILDLSEDRFKHMSSTLAPEADEEWSSNIIMTIKATLGINGVAKMVRHNLELAKKTGNIQILLMLQMSLPMIMRTVKAQFDGMHAFSEGKPVGDGIGPIVAGKLLEDVEDADIHEVGEMVVAEKDFKGRELIIARAQGPGARVGKVGKVVTSIINEKNIKRIITVDAAVKLEGEKTGTVAEGIGVVIGGPGVDKWLIEEELVKSDLHVDAVIVKMSPEEAISQMTNEIFESSQKAVSVVENAILQSSEGSKVLVVGVGNSCGIPVKVEELSQINIKEDKKNNKKEDRKWPF